MKLSVIAAVAATILAGTSMQAEACNPLLNKSFGKHVAPTVVPAAMLARNQPATSKRDSIVGMWHDVRTMSDGSLFMEGYDTWDKDGTENELANLPPAAGAFCVGLWTKHGNSISLITHVAWTYDLDNNYTGTLNITQTERMAPDGNSYTGPFDAKFYDVNGNLTQEIAGTATAERMGQ